MSEYLSDEIKLLQSDLEILKTDNDSLNISNAMLTKECDMLRTQCATLRRERDEQFDLAIKMRTILEQQVASITGGLQRMRDARRIKQEQDLGVGSDDKPEFLQKDNVAHIPQTPEPQRGVNENIADDRLPRVEPNGRRAS